MTTQVQLPLVAAPPFRSLARGDRHYVPALQNKPGELRALREAPEDIWSHFTPLLEVVGPKSPGTAPFTRNRVHAWVKKIGAAVTDHPIFLDRLRLAPNHLVQERDGRVPVLTAIYNSARLRRLAFVPVLHLGDAPATAEQVSLCVAQDERGAAIRVPVLGTAMPDGQELSGMLDAAVASLGVEVEAVDLLMDLRQLSEDLEVDAQDLAAVVEEMISVGPWRNVVLMGTTMPRSLGGGVVAAGTVGRLPRREWLLWRELRATALSRMPTYGDYAVQHPDPPLDVAAGQLPLGLRGAIRYTHDEVTVIPRAKAPRHEEGREQYRELCRVLVQQPEYAGGDFSWGDGQIDYCAAGTCEPGWEDHWRGAATSHHIRLVVEQLNRL